MSYDLTALSAWTDESSHAFDFWADALLKNESAASLRQLSGVKAPQALPSIDAENGQVQASTCASTVNGDVVYDQVVITPVSMEDFRTFCIKDLEGFYTAQHLDAGQMYEGLQKTESVILMRIAETISRSVEQMTWQGEAGGANPDASLNLVDGFNHLIDDAIVATTITATSTGAITSANAVGFVEGLIDAAIADPNTASLVHNGGYTLYLGHDAMRAYTLNYRTLFGDNTHADQMGAVIVPGTSVRMVAVGGLNGTNYMHLVRNESYVQSNDIAGEETNIKVGLDEFEKNVWTRSEFRIGFAIRAINQTFVHTAA